MKNSSNIQSKRFGVFKQNKSLLSSGFPSMQIATFDTWGKAHDYAVNASRESKQYVFSIGPARYAC